MKHGPLEIRGVIASVGKRDTRLENVVLAARQLSFDLGAPVLFQFEGQWHRVRFVDEPIPMPPSLADL